MTAAATPSQPPAGLVPLFVGIVRSEARKLGTVRSTFWALLPSSWQDTLGPYLPMNAGGTIYTVRPEAHALGPWAGFGVFCLYAAAALAAGFILIGRRDA